MRPEDPEDMEGCKTAATALVLILLALAIAAGLGWAA